MSFNCRANNEQTQTVSRACAVIIVHYVPRSRSMRCGKKNCANTNDFTVDSIRGNLTSAIDEISRTIFPRFAWLLEIPRRRKCICTKTSDPFIQNANNLPITCWELSACVSESFNPRVSFRVNLFSPCVSPCDHANVKRSVTTEGSDCTMRNSIFF